MSPAGSFMTGGSGQGSVTVIDLVSDNSDDLTLGSLRALRQADVIAHDAGVSAEILDYARRDARRVALDAALPEDARVVVLRSAVLAKRAGGAA